MKRVQKPDLRPQPTARHRKELVVPKLWSGSSRWREVALEMSDRAVDELARHDVAMVFVFAGNFLHVHAAQGPFSPAEIGLLEQASAYINHHFAWEDLQLIGLFSFEVVYEEEGIPDRKSVV